MWRYVAGGAAGLAAIAAGVMAWDRGGARSESLLPSAPVAQSRSAETPEGPVPEATAETREQKRFGRYDKDRDGAVTRDEYLAQRRKAYAKLDADGDGKLSFDEWAVKATTKFAAADRDKSGGMTTAEFATTAVKRKPKLRCPPAGARGARPEQEQAAEES